MYCPRCSQPQMFDNVRFCSRCGFQLSAVKAILADGDSSLPRTSEIAMPDRSQRKRDLTIGVLLMFLFAFHTAWTTEDLSLERKFTGLIIKCLILCALINLVPKIRDFFRRSTTRDRLSSSKLFSGLTVRFNGNDQTYALPPARSRAAADYVTPSIRTGEFLAPPSVTERTTSLLSGNAN